jgi:hypothetical protein
LRLTAATPRSVSAPVDGDPGAVEQVDDLVQLVGEHGHRAEVSATVRLIECRAAARYRLICTLNVGT